MTDLVPSMSDTLLRNGGLFDAHMFREGAEKWASENPGTTCPFTNTVAQVRLPLSTLTSPISQYYSRAVALFSDTRPKQAANSTTINSTLTLDLEFKRALPEGALS